MMILTYTTLTTIPLVLLFLILSIRVIRYRRSNQVGLGDAGDKSLLKRIRAQANFIEYVPFALLLLALIELQGIASWVLILLGVMLVSGRVLHAYGFSTSPPKMRLRAGGMLLTLNFFLVAIPALIWTVFAH